MGICGGSFSILEFDSLRILDADGFGWRWRMKIEFYSFLFLSSPLLENLPDHPALKAALNKPELNALFEIRR